MARQVEFLRNWLAFLANEEDGLDKTRYLS
jgi:hypothetical protein